MTLEQAKAELEKFVKLKTTQRPAFVDVLLEAEKPVIRCKDCAFYWYHKLKQDGTPDKRYNPSHCYYWGQGRNPNEYCSRAVDQVSLKNAIEEMIEEIKEEIEENERKRKEEL